MTQEKRQNLQDTFLNSVRKTKTPLTIFLVNGVKLQGIVTWFDNFCVLLRRDGQSQLVYKTRHLDHHALRARADVRAGSRRGLSVSPHRPLGLNSKAECCVKPLV